MAGRYLIESVEKMVADALRSYDDNDFRTVKKIAERAGVSETTARGWLGHLVIFHKDEFESGAHARGIGYRVRKSAQENVT